MIYSIRHLPRRIPIGIQTETGVQGIGFDVRPWIEQYGQLDFAVWPTRPGETTAYPASDVKLIEGILYWWPNGTDTAIPGNGKVEIIGITAEKRKLSGACETSIRATSLPTDPETPDANRPWVDEVIEAATRAHSSALSAAESADRAEASENASKESEASAAGSAESAAKSAENAATSATEAAQSADRAEMAAGNLGWFDVEVNDDGHLIYTRTENVDAVDFVMDEGRLVVVYG